MKFIIKIIYKLVYQTNYRNFIAIFLFRLNLIPDEYKDRVRAMLKSKQYEKKFLKLNLSYDELGFYYLDPMPSKDFLKDYYEETYWHNRNDKFDLIYGSHSLEHVQNIKETIKKFNEISHENTIFFLKCQMNLIEEKFHLHILIILLENFFIIVLKNMIIVKL